MAFNCIRIYIPWNMGIVRLLGIQLVIAMSSRFGQKIVSYYFYFLSFILGPVSKQTITIHMETVKWEEKTEPKLCEAAQDV